MLKVKREKHCCKCNQTLPINNFYTNGVKNNKDGTATQRYKPYCKICENMSNTLDFYKKIKNILTSYNRFWKCERCGYDTYISALDFHHINSEEKDFDLAKGKTFSAERLEAEINKCEILCANCHRVEHTINKLEVSNV